MSKPLSRNIPIRKAKISTVCDALGAACEGPFSIYDSGKGLGIEIHSNSKDSAEEMLIREAGEEDVVTDANEEVQNPELTLSDKVKLSDKYKQYLEKVKYAVILNRLIIKTEYDIDIDELSVNGKVYPFKKMPYAKSFLYTVTAPDIQDLVSAIVTAFVIELYAREATTRKEKMLGTNNSESSGENLGAEMGGEMEGGGGEMGGLGGFGNI